MEKTDIKSLDYEELTRFVCRASAKSRSGQNRSTSGCMKSRSDGFEEMTNLSKSLQGAAGRNLSACTVLRSVTDAGFEDRRNQKIPVPPCRTAM